MSLIDRYYKFFDFLHEVAPYVVLCGSYARGEENENSDLDFYVRQKPQNPDEEPPMDTSYLPEIMEVCRKYGYEMDSCVIGSITLSAEATGTIQVEFSYMYKLPVDNPIEVKNWFVPFLACVDDKDVPYEKTKERTNDLGEIEDWIPYYEEVLKQEGYDLSA